MRSLICLRSTDENSPTFRMGALLASLSDSVIVLMTVLDEGADQEEAEKALEVAAVKLRASAGVVSVTTKVALGAPAEQILAETRESEYEMLVVGAHEISGFWDSLVRSIMTEVTERARLPVLVVRGRVSPVSRLLVCVGSSRPRRRTVRAARWIADKVGASATVLFVADPVPTMYTGLDQMDESLSDLLQTDTPMAAHLRWSADHLASHGVQADIELRRGAVSNEILAEAEKGNYDLIVVGAGPNIRFLKRALLWPLARSLFENAPCPVLVVH